MDLLQLAQLRFQELVPKIAATMTVETSDAVESWLREQVVAVVDQLGEVQRFRKFTRWSLDQLSPGRDTPQRKLVEAMDRVLVAAAKETAKAARALGVFPPAVTKEEAVSVIDWLAARPWFDLVCPEEFFTGERGLHLTTSRPDCHAEFWGAADPRVPLGDYVSRGLLMRTEYFAHKIDEIWQDCWQESQQQGQVVYSLADRLLAAKTVLDRAHGELRQACYLNSESGLRDACTTLVLVYVAYSPNPALDWLGFQRDHATAHAPLIRNVVRPSGEIIMRYPTSAGHEVVERSRAKLCRRDVVEGIARALAMVSKVYYRPTESEELVEWLRQEKQLVMVDRRPRAVYWQGEPVGTNWDRRSTRWDLLWKLAERARRRQPVHHEELTHGVGSSAVKNRRSHLSADIPASLDRLIEDVRPGGYRLNLAPEQIVLLELDSDDQLVEVGPQIKPRAKALLSPES